MSPEYRKPFIQNRKIPNPKDSRILNLNTQEYRKTERMLNLKIYDKSQTNKRCKFWK